MCAPSQLKMLAGLEYTVNIFVLPIFSEACNPAQGISAAEEEAAKKRAGSAAAVKQLGKLRREAAKTSKEAERTADELASKKEEHKVPTGSFMAMMIT